MAAFLAPAAGLSIAAFGGASPAGAATVGSWIQVGSSPTLGRWGAPMAYDAATHQLVLFGGQDRNGTDLNDTWVWNGTAQGWSQLRPPQSPSARLDAALAYDSSTGQLILFGGADTSGALDDTWTWTGRTWRQLSPTQSPPARFNAAVADDETTGQLILFGGASGLTNQSPFYGDTWGWTGTTWTLHGPTTSPPSRTGARLAYDSSTRQLILFGGQTNAAVNLNDTWEWDGTGDAWTLLGPPSSPRPRVDASMSYDPRTRRILLFGGSGNTPRTRHDTWVWNGTTWAQVSPLVSPAARYDAASAYDARTSQFLLFGGTDRVGLVFGDSWAWHQLGRGS